MHCLNGEHEVAKPLDPRRAKLHYNYYVADIAILYGVHRNTVRMWISNGLKTIRVVGLTIILGDELRDFLEKRRSARRVKTPPGHLYCLRCRKPQMPAGGMVELVRDHGSSGNVRALCDCGVLMHRRVSLSKIEEAGFPSLAPDGQSDA